MVAVALALGLLLAPLEWQGDRACRPIAQVESALVDLGAATNTADVTVTTARQSETWTARIAIRQGESATLRVLADPDCDTLARAIALVIAVSTVPIAAAQSPAVRAVIVPSPIVAPTATPASPPLGPIADAPRPVPPPRKPAWAWWIGGGIDVGRFSRPFGTLTTSGAVRLGSARIELGAIAALPRTLTHPARSTVSARVWSIAGILRGCWVLKWRRLEAPVCAGAEAGTVLASARGLTDEGSALAPWVAAVVGPRLSWTAPGRRVSVAPLVGVDAVVSIVRPRFTVDDLPGNLARAQSAGVRAILGLELKWGDETRRTRR